MSAVLGGPRDLTFEQSLSVLIAAAKQRVVPPDFSSARSPRGYAHIAMTLTASSRAGTEVGLIRFGRQAS
jgi:hypothetical protein